MCWVFHQLSNHSLDNANVSIQNTADTSTSEGNPKVGGEANDQ